MPPERCPWANAPSLTSACAAERSRDLGRARSGARGTGRRGDRRGGSGSTAACRREAEHARAAVALDPAPPVFAFGAAAAAVAAAAIVIAVGVGGGSPAPLRFAMVVSGTPLAPNAHGNASLTKTDSGWRIELKATGLPHLSGTNSYYQAWLKNPAGVLVPVGTFNDGRNVTLWSGVPVTKFRAFTVTVQQANGNPVSSGRRVLTGTAHPVG